MLRVSQSFGRFYVSVSLFAENSYEGRDGLSLWILITEPSSGLVEVTAHVCMCVYILYIYQKLKQFSPKESM